MPNWLIQRIEEYSTIILFRHILPDMDAFGSQLGLYEWIKSAYPDKKVYCAGKGSSLTEKLHVEMDVLSDDIFKDALGIITDTSNKERVDDQRYALCKHTCRIDHHVFVEKYCDEEWIDSSATAACEMLGLFFKENHIQLPSQAAQYFYSGLMADSIRLTISTVRSQSFEAAKYLFEQGVDVISSDQLNFSSSLSDYFYETVVRNHVQVKNNFLYSIVDKKEYEEAGLTFASAKDKVYVLSGIDSITIWALFTQMDDGIHYSASLRSKTIGIRDVASDFGGGGHECASGIKNLSLEQVLQIVDILSKRS